MTGLEFHLAWSLWQYLIAFLFFLAGSAYIVFSKTFKDPELGFTWKGKTAAIIGWLVVLNYAAFDVGGRQSDINRSAFNAPDREQVEKVESDRLTRGDIKNTIVTEDKQ